MSLGLGLLVVTCQQVSLNITRDFRFSTNLQHNQHFATLHLCEYHSVWSVEIPFSPTLSCRTMSDVEMNGSLDVSIEEDIRNLFGEEEEEEVHPEDMIPDTMGSLIVGEDQLFSATQAVALMEQPSSGSARSAEVELSLQPLLLSSWSQEVEDEEMALLEPSSEVQQGRRSQGLLHTSIEVSPVDTSRDGVELASAQPEPLEQEDLAREARYKASYLAAQHCFSGCSSRL